MRITRWVVRRAAAGGLAPWAVFGGCLLFRLLNGLSVQTYFNPDEYWQGPEIAHRLVYGYGEALWEWKAGARIRGFFHPLVLSVGYWVLRCVGVDDPDVVAAAPRVVQAVLNAGGDWAVWTVGTRLFGRRIGLLGLVFQLASWFVWYAGARPYSNSLEAALTMLALAWWPLLLPKPEEPVAESDDARSREAPGSVTPSSAPSPSAAASSLTASAASVRWAVALGVFSCVARPTAVLWWAVLGLRLLVHLRALYPSRTPSRAHFVFGYLFPAIALPLALSFLWDSVLYGEPVWVPIQFLRINLLEGLDRLYGAQPWHAYLTVHLPPVVLLHGLTAVVGWVALLRLERTGASASSSSPSPPPPSSSSSSSSSSSLMAASDRVWLGIATCVVIAALSFAGHKEMRFLLPILPFVHIYSAAGVAHLVRGVGDFLAADASAAPAPTTAERTSASSSSLEPESSTAPAKHESTQPRGRAVSVGSAPTSRSAAQKLPSLLRSPITVALLALHVPMALYFSFFHLRGSVAVMEWLRHEAASLRGQDSTYLPMSVHFWGGCHNTPFFSEVHQPIEMVQLDCSPSARMHKLGSAADRFLQNATRFLREEMYGRGLPPPPHFPYERRPWPYIAWAQCMDDRPQHLFRGIVKTPAALSTPGLHPRIPDTARRYEEVKRDPRDLMELSGVLRRPSHVVVFDRVVPEVRRFLDGFEFEPVFRSFHNPVPTLRAELHRWATEQLTALGWKGTEADETDHGAAALPALTPGSWSWASWKWWALTRLEAATRLAPLQESGDEMDSAFVWVFRHKSWHEVNGAGRNTAVLEREL